ncbi:MAG: hypothetical protein AAB420_00390 [Patescibacteria group bacterium]
MQQQTKTIIRWILAPIIGYGIAFIVAVGFVFGSIFGVIPMLDSVNGLFLILAFASTFASVIVGSLIAPSHKTQTALALSLGLPLVSFLINRDFQSMFWVNAGGMVAGGLFATLLTWLWTKPNRTQQTHKVIVIVCTLVFVAGGGILFARLMDYPAKPDSTPGTLSWYPVSAFYSYRLAGFIDETNFWRFEANKETIQKIAVDSRFEQTTDVPDDFFYYRPYWWPKKLPQNYLAFKSPEFSFDVRPGDGDYYFLVYDQDLQRAYVWVDDNF